MDVGPGTGEAAQLVELAFPVAVLDRPAGGGGAGRGEPHGEPHEQEDD